MHLDMLGVVVTFELRMLTFDLRMLTFELHGGDL